MASRGRAARLFFRFIGFLRGTRCGGRSTRHRHGSRQWRERRQHRTRRSDRLVGADAEPASGGAQGSQRLHHLRIEHRQLDRVLAVMVAEPRHQADGGRGIPVSGLSNVDGSRAPRVSAVVGDRRVLRTSEPSQADRAHPDEPGHAPPDPQGRAREGLCRDPGRARLRHRLRFAADLRTTWTYRRLYAEVSADVGAPGASQFPTHGAHKAADP